MAPSTSQDATSAADTTTTTPQSTTANSQTSADSTQTSMPSGTCAAEWSSCRMGSVSSDCCPGFTCVDVNTHYAQCEFDDNQDANLIRPYQQCGGSGFTGNTDCVLGYSCSVSNSFYSQCTPDHTTQGRASDSSVDVTMGIANPTSVDNMNNIRTAVATLVGADANNLSMSLQTSQSTRRLRSLKD